MTLKMLSAHFPSWRWRKKKKIIKANQIFSDFIRAQGQVNDFLIACAATSPWTRGDHNRVMGSERIWTRMSSGRWKDLNGFSYSGECLYRAVRKSKSAGMMLVTRCSVKCLSAEISIPQPSGVEVLQPGFKYFCVTVNIQKKISSNQG